MVLDINIHSTFTIYISESRRYEIDNITMRYTLEYESWTQFLVNICAIMGGSFAILGLINQMIQQNVTKTS